MTILVIADTFNKGMKSQGCVGLLPYNKKYNLFQQQYKSIRSVFPKAKILYVYGFEGKKFLNFINGTPITNMEILFNPEHNIHNHGHSLYLAKEYLETTDECLILLGYEPININYLKALHKMKKSTAIITKDSDSKLGCILEKDSNNLTHIFYGLSNYINNIYLLKKPELQLVLKLLNHDNIHNMFLFETINLILSQHGKMGGLEV
jgi:hypothetical protein